MLDINLNVGAQSKKTMVSTAKELTIDFDTEYDKFVHVI